MKKLKARYNSTSRSDKLGLKEEKCENTKTSSEVEIEVLKKVGVLRTDFCGEMLAGVGARGGGSALRRIHALFI